ncbi:MAG: PDZ domain-containing protein [Chitinophagaceae bacterium]
MKQSIKKMSFVLLASALMAPVALLAQKEDKDKDKVKEKKEAEQIIITRKGNSDEKMVIEVNGDKVTVNGKSVDELKDGDVTVHRSKVKDVWAFNGDNFKSFNGNNNLAALSAMDENRAMLGVTTDNDDQGAEIQSITKEGGAEKAGLKKGDIITKVGDAKISDPDDLTKAIRSHKPGDKIDITYLRDKKEQKVNAELGKWKGVNGYALGRGQQNYGFTMPDVNVENIMPRIRTTPGRTYNYNMSWSGSSTRLGLSVQDTDDGKGVKVIDVDEDGNGAKAGIKEDDIITSVDGKAVNSTDEITKIMKESKDKISVKFQLQRKGKSESVDVKIPRKLKSADL